MNIFVNGLLLTVYIQPIFSFVPSSNTLLNQHHDESQHIASLLTSEDTFTSAVNRYSSLMTSDNLVESIETPVIVRQEYKDMSDAQESAGKGFILVYVGFSLLAGVKEFATRFNKWRKNREK